MTIFALFVGMVEICCFVMDAQGHSIKNVHLYQAFHLVTGTITKRCIRIVKDIEAELSGCALCRGYDFSKSGFGPRTIILCDQCEKEYDVGCLRDHKMAYLKELPEGDWFCCTDCNRIHSTLRKFLIRGTEKLPDSLVDLIQLVDVTLSQPWFMEGMCGVKSLEECIVQYYWSIQLLYQLACFEFWVKMWPNFLWLQQAMVIMERATSNYSSHAFRDCWHC
ncbi:hypothetical protein K1719_021848 [Acacia pycnantha]|nr:hypothetical protein K1719_021848 [Acacia pycnantha]